MQDEKKLKEMVLAKVKKHFPDVYDIEIIGNKYVKCFKRVNLSLFDMGDETEFYTSDLPHWLNEENK